MNNTSVRIPELDGVRGIAILMVLVYHLSLICRDSPNWLIHGALGLARFGGTGVDLFFVLSGFLICGILLDNREAANYFKVFYSRRAFRILPLYFLFLFTFFTLSFAWHHGLFNAPDWLMDVSIPRWAYLTFTHNFVMAHQNSLGSRLLAPTWSLAVEEQFYLTLPLLIWILPRRFLSKAFVIIIVGAILSRIVLRLTFPLNDTALLVLTPCRADNLALGALIAVSMRCKNVPAFLERHRKILYAILVMLILSVMTREPLGIFQRAVFVNNYPIPMKVINDFARYLLFSLIYGTFLLIALNAGQRSWVSRFCRLRILREIGILAYCVYLIHSVVEYIIVLQFGAQTPMTPSGTLLLEYVLILAITFLIAKASWVYFEKPLIRYGHRFLYENPGESPPRDSMPARDVASVSI